MDTTGVPEEVCGGSTIRRRWNDWIWICTGWVHTGSAADPTGSSSSSGSGSSPGNNAQVRRGKDNAEPVRRQGVSKAAPQSIHQNGQCSENDTQWDAVQGVPALE